MTISTCMRTLTKAETDQITKKGVCPTCGTKLRPMPSDNNMTKLHCRECGNLYHINKEAEGRE